MGGMSNDNDALRALNDFHRQILSCRDKRTLTVLLARYVARVADRACASSPTRPPIPPNTRLNEMMNMIAEISRNFHDTAQAIINNTKA